MKLELTAEQKTFQADVRGFLDNTLPEDISKRVLNGLPPLRDDFTRWQQLLNEKGWLVPNWPPEYGGTGWTTIQRHIWETECARAGAPQVNPFNFKMLGPVIYTFGNEQQKQRFLPDILASKVFFCQGYSEPNAGSDLASLKTTAVRDGDSYIVNGTKTWTTYGHYADWIFCLVRTAGPHVKNQEAISFLLIDLNSPGVTVSPIITLDGRHEINEINFDEVRVPTENLIGDEGKGWTYAKYLLTHERTNTATVGASRQRLSSVETHARQSSDGNDPRMNDVAFANRYTDVEIELLALEYTELRTLSAIHTGQAPGPESSILKYLGTQVTQAIDELNLELAGYYGLALVPEQFESGYEGEHLGPGMASNAAPKYFNNRKVTIYGGSSEVQKEIICKHVLGL